ncbi:MAG TPA: DUF397 domain-containing protein [Pseudonocardiaceae bacterium]|jgi:hypothetical protein|nr:DUF397 domain-containing protein [Pseudonocardiaceae bacterium]
MTHGPHRWHKSSYSGQGTNCVELSADLEQIRDSKNPAGPALSANVPVLLDEIKSGRLTH